MFSLLKPCLSRDIRFALRSRGFHSAALVPLSCPAQMPMLKSGAAEYSRLAGLSRKQTEGAVKRGSAPKPLGEVPEPSGEALQPSGEGGVAEFPQGTLSLPKKATPNAAFPRYGKTYSAPCRQVISRKSGVKRPAYTILCAARKVPRVTRKVLRVAQKIL